MAYKFKSLFILKGYGFFFSKYAACKGGKSPIELEMREIPAIGNMSTFMIIFLLEELILLEKDWKNILKDRSCVRVAFVLGLGP